MRNGKKGFLIVLLAVALVVAGIVTGVRLLNEKWKRDAIAIRCPVFDTRAYVAGTELEGRDLSALLRDGTSIHEDQVRYWGPTNISITEYSGTAYPTPFAVLLKTEQDEQPVFCRPDGVDVAETLAEANTLIYIERSGPHGSGRHCYCTYQPYFFTLSGKYWLCAENKHWGNTTQEGLASAISSIEIAAPGSANPLDQYIANFEKVKAFDFMALIDSAVPADSDSDIEYIFDNGAYHYDDDTRACPCYDLTDGYWRHGEFELNGDPPLYIMTSEITGKTPIAGAYAVIGSAYVYVYRIRVYDCDAGTYVEFSWHPSTKSRDHVGGVMAEGNLPPWVYYLIQK